MNDGCKTFCHTAKHLQRERNNQQLMAADASQAVHTSKTPDSAVLNLSNKYIPPTQRSFLTVKTGCQQTKPLQDLHKEDHDNQHGNHFQSLQVHIQHVGTLTVSPWPDTRSPASSTACGPCNSSQEPCITGSDLRATQVRRRGRERGDNERVEERGGREEEGEMEWQG